MQGTYSVRIKLFCFGGLRDIFAIHIEWRIAHDESETHTALSVEYAPNPEDFSAHLVVDSSDNGNKRGESNVDSLT